MTRVTRPPLTRPGSSTTTRPARNAALAFGTSAAGMPVTASTASGAMTTTNDTPLPRPERTPK
ncbi:hypothetical protein [Actinosynnema sp. ALI-1.44]|uniref:hypothetical protein n=1 Tax=Actinosynnema sp. ALI-1.44 TaxID=1933779 RepID=UPI0011785C48|nr:hypothetical protein [Actinosynnema sp. ALI-1.44]